MSSWSLIDFEGLVFNALWIVGLSLNLAAFSLAEFRRTHGSRRLRDVWSEPGYQMASNAGLLLVCVGLIHSARAWWEAVLWGGLALAFAAFLFQAWRARKAVAREKQHEEGNSGGKGAAG